MCRERIPTNAVVNPVRHVGDSIVLARGSISTYFYNVQPVLSLMCAMYSLPALPCRLLSSVGASKAMVDYFSVGVRAILHSVKDLTEALLDPSRHAHLNGLTGMVSA